jgi:phage shock protein A
MAPSPRPPVPAITVPQALQAIDDARSELSPQIFAALKAIGEALVSLTYEVVDAKQRAHRLRSDLDALESDVDGLETDLDALAVKVVTFETDG